VQRSRNQVLFNLRTHLFNDAKAAGNIGMGWRYSLNNDSSRIGVQIFYDFRDYSHFFASQMGIGFEWISQHIDIRINGYLPIGDHESFHSKKFQGFSGNHLIIKKKFSAALPCLEGEIGTPAAKPFYFAVGSYYLFTEKSHSLRTGRALGAKARFDVDIGRYCTLGALATYDPIFRTRVQGILTLNIPLGPTAKSPKKRQCRNLEFVPIVRNEIIPIQTRKKSKAPLESSEEELVGFLFVNNAAPADGLGTFESPFSSLKEAEKNSKPGDVIYVFAGDGTAHLMDEGIVLKHNQILVSSGSELKIDEVLVPALTPGQTPVLTNIHTDQPVVTNPGKTKLDNFYFMNPWEYLGNYDFHSYSIDSSYSPSIETPSPWNDPSLRDWVDLRDNSSSQTTPSGSSGWLNGWTMGE
jgi:hypothetical protein